MMLSGRRTVTIATLIAFLATEPHDGNERRGYPSEVTVVSRGAIANAYTPIERQPTIL